MRENPAEGTTVADKLKMLTVDELRMDEVAHVERMSGYSLTDLGDFAQSPPTSLVMALAFVTERRAKPGLKPESYNSMTPNAFVKRLYATFEFEQSDTNYDNWTVRDLKLELGKRGLDEKGKKDELIARMRQADEASADGGDVDPTKDA